ncbi:N-acetylmuramidase domain-containing protein [uncultured Nitratireductor sp.]|uniref:N-acetylmuramidase domain-containing protein n=1 Tax=uncultured Nitratireductor sp. TaxID=520953 RepID=UPI0026099471|nr:N-acetylmuramidase domain-containing protein [uncultured Nitratireductor sp.]
MFSDAEIGEIRDAALAAGLEPALLLAVAQVESGGQVSAMVRGRAEPPIRFEGHYFDRRLSGAKQAAARAAGLASPEAGAVANPRSQAARWALLKEAARIDRKAAYESVSWGVGQVMGAHWSWLGFADVEALVAEAREGLAGQMRLMLRYIEKAGLKEPLAAHDWARFARGYNGPGYRRNRYDRKLAQAYRAYAGKRVEGRQAADGLLKMGARGEAVESVQTMLSAQGYPVAVDGVFGRRTEEALKRFQAEAGVTVDGVVGPVTRAALRRSLPLTGLFARAKAFVLRLWRDLPRAF